MSANAKGALLALLAFGIFATHDVFVKTLGAIYSPIQIVFFSVLFSFPLATVMLMRDAKPSTLLPRHPWWMALRTIASVAIAVSAFYAFTVLPLAQTYAILFASPLLITILAIPVLGETVRLRRWLAVIVGLTGVMVVLQPGAAELTLGHAAALTAAVGGSIASIIVRRIGADERPVVMLLYPTVAILSSWVPRSRLFISPCRSNTSALLRWWRRLRGQPGAASSRPINPVRRRSLHPCNIARSSGRRCMARYFSTKQ